jgi:hypothetical protein
VTLVALLLIATHAETGSETLQRVPQPTLIETFRTFCLADSASDGRLAAPAAAAGFHPVPVNTSNPGWNEIEAWQRGGVRLFALSANADPPTRPICGVSANIGPLGEDNDLLDPLARLTQAGFVGGNPGSPHASWNMANRRGLVRISIDRTRQPEVSVVLSVQPWQQ